MSSHQAISNSNKPRSLKSCHFCLPFDLHNYCPSCGQAGKGDDPCVTNEQQCLLCKSFTEEQKLKIKNRRLYVRKQKLNSSKDELDLLGEPEVEDAFSGSHEDLENVAEQLYSSPSCPQPLRFEYLSLKMPQTVPTPGTALQNRIENKIEKSLGSQLNIQLQQEMGVLQVSIMEAMQSLREVDQISASDPKPGPSEQPDDLPSYPNTQPHNMQGT